jgi:N-acetylglucosamine kinase-like BadF-type ATPase
MVWLTKLWGSVKVYVITAVGIVTVILIWLRAHDKRVAKRALYEQQKKKLEVQEKELKKLRERTSGEDASLEEKIEKNQQEQDRVNRDILRTIEEGEERREAIDRMSADDVVARVNQLLNE